VRGRVQHQVRGGSERIGSVDRCYCGEGSNKVREEQGGGKRKRKWTSEGSIVERRG